MKDQWGGGILESKGKNPKVLQRYDKNKKIKTIFIGSIIGVIAIIGGISLYRSFAMYEEKKTFDVLNGVVPKFSKNKLFSEYIVEQKESDQAIEEFQHEATSQTIALTDYRYTGANPNNYVCFGSEAETCPEENLYRIIGVIPTQSKINGEYENRVKLVKATPYEENESSLLQYCKETKAYGYKRNNVENNTWETSTLNKNVLNGVYWKNLNDYQKYIGESVWYLGAYSESQVKTTFTPNTIYSFERGNNKAYSGGDLSYVNYIGLLYTSDYVFAAGNTYKDTVWYPNRETYKNYTWLTLNNETEWVISSTTDIIGGWFIEYTGYVCGSYIIDRYTIYKYDTSYMIRPSFYLKSTVFYKDGTGTKESPYRIDLKN